MSFLINIRLLLAGLWLGAAVYFVGTAQNAFAVLPTRELAGTVVSRNLLVLNIAGIVIGLILLASSFIKNVHLNAFWRWTERFLLIVLMGACAIGEFVISIWLSSIKTQLGKPIDEVAADDPLKLQFDQLHQYSVWVLMTAMISALILFLLIGLRGKAEKPVVVEKNVFDINKEFKL